MRNPNGYGGVKKLSGNRRKPYAARITTGWTEDGKQRFKYIGYFKTKREALQYLAEYNEDPYTLANKKTFAEVFEGWFSDYLTKDTIETTKKNYITAFNECKQLHNKVFADIRLQEFQDNTDAQSSHSSASHFASLANQMSRWAVAHDYASKNYATAIEIKQKKNKRKESERFSDDEIEIVFAQDSLAAKIVQILLYTGMRVSELLNLKREDVNIAERYFTIKSAKTEAGLRIVPLHKRIMPVITEFYEQDKPYLITTKYNKKMSYTNFVQVYWPTAVNNYGIKKTRHDCRHTLVSKMTAAKCDKTLIKKIVGHKRAEDLTEKVYTHITPAELVAEIDMIK